MGITVGAALKKVAAAILTEPKVLKNILFAILVVLVALLLPMVMVVCLFSGRFQVDTAELQRHVEANLFSFCGAWKIPWRKLNST